jgi:hypothetical protein
MNLLRIVYGLVIPMLAAVASISGGTEHQGKSFAGRVTASTVSQRFDAETIIAQANPRFVITVEVTESTDPAVKIGEIKKIAIHSPVITFGADGGIGREVRCSITKPVGAKGLPSGHLSVSQKHVKK